jgi:hypothetical protein
MHVTLLSKTVIRVKKLLRWPNRFRIFLLFKLTDFAIVRINR